MQREIKFRAWSKSKNEMLRVSGFMNMNANNAPPILHTVSASGGEEGHVYDKADWVLMQYTGLKDKNEKPIYEGDILGGGGYKHLVRWQPIEARYQAICLWNNSPGNACGIDQYWIDETEKIVIGNIHENAELLEGK